MTIFTAPIIFALLWQCIYSDDMILSRDLVSSTTAVPNNCTDARQCPNVNNCTECDEDRGPNCDQPICTAGKCGMIERCSQIRASTTTPPDPRQCTGTDTRTCKIPFVCASCPEGYSPGCDTAVCVNNRCEIVHACSIEPLQDTTTAATDKCEDDSQCLQPKYCVDQCENGLGALCTTAKCVKKKCQIIQPCSPPTQCTQEEFNVCVPIRICAQCKEGRSPPCTLVTCSNGECSVIEPCSIFDPPTTRTISTMDICSCDRDCPRRRGCGMKCVKGQCIHTKPSSQGTCKTRVTCPYNKRNCAKCAPGFGPGCEQPVCSRGICSIVPPCSTKAAIAAEILPIKKK